MQIPEFTIDILFLLFLTALLASFLDTLAGGGGLLTIPALILSGIPPLAALGTNKFQSSMGTATATFMMLKNKKVSWEKVKGLMLFAFIGSALGASTVQLINPEALSFIIPIVLLFIAFYFLFAPKPKENDGEPKMAYKKYRNFIIPIICIFSVYQEASRTTFSYFQPFLAKVKPSAKGSILRSNSTVNPSLHRVKLS